MYDTPAFPINSLDIFRIMNLLLRKKKKISVLYAYIMLCASDSVGLAKKYANSVTSKLF